ncbi:site-specific integrase [Rhizobium leguminosarum]|uniref:site-specific integrase n=1 Tax=Rhizobium leguminosarum TaxID=384 RepID=UPI003D0549DF
MLYIAELRRRGYSKQSVSGHVWSARRFLRTIWDEQSGVSRLTHSEVRDYLTNSFGGQNSKSLVTWFSHLRVLLRFPHASRHTDRDLSTAVPSPNPLSFSGLSGYCMRNISRAVSSISFSSGASFLIGSSASSLTLLPS